MNISLLIKTENKKTDDNLKFIRNRCFDYEQPTGTSARKPLDWGRSNKTDFINFEDYPLEPLWLSISTKLLSDFTN